MFCTNCGTNHPEATGFCSNCGGPLNRENQPPPAPVFSAPRPTSPGSTLSTIGIICGAIAFLFVPIVFGPAGLILGAVAKSKGEDKAVIAMIVSGAGLVGGMIIGALVSTYL